MIWSERNQELEDPIRSLRRASRCLKALQSDVTSREETMEEAISGLGNSALLGVEVAYTAGHDNLSRG